MNKAGYLLIFVSILAFAGNTLWTVQQSPTAEVFNGISSSDQNFTVAVGNNGVIVHYIDGAPGTLIPSGTTENLYDVYVGSKNLAIATGNDVVLRWDGVVWEEVTSGSNDIPFTGTWITPEQDVMFYQSLGFFNFICPNLPGVEPGDQPFCRGFNEPMLTACGNSGDIKFIFDNGDILQLNNNLGEINGDGLVHDEASDLSLTAAWVENNNCTFGFVPPREIMAIRNTNEFWLFDGSSWSNLNVTVPNDQTLSWLGGVSINALWAVGFKPDGNGGNEAVLWHYDGATWVEDASLPAGMPGLTDVAVHFGLVDLIFTDGFEPIIQRVPELGAFTIDILAAAEEGKMIKGEIASQFFTTTVADIKVTKSLLTAEPISQNDVITYELTIENLGPQSASSVTFGDMFRKNMHLVTDGCTTEEEFDTLDVQMRKTVIPLLEVGQSITCTMSFLVVSAAGTELVNSALATDNSDNNVDFNKSNNVVTIKTMVQ
ncbi:DUF11 domain-containing protein [Marinicella rhabdoformis]|uniref:DUF11 domain-containing protein n=1 Tax=Marinicella rhabdoformis TaxID=2580566 RepID=UPI0012AEB252|nr:DUF11 domain-containing protein [Marinicella rhabdoformis]